MTYEIQKPTIIAASLIAAGFYITPALAVNLSAANDPANVNPQRFLTNNEFKYSNYLAPIGAEYAFAKGYTGGIYARNANGTLLSNSRVGSVVVTEIDTGVDATHPDLAGQVLSGVTCEYSLGGCVGGAWPDPWHGDDSWWHGTDVASVIVGKNDNHGTEGVAPNALVLPIRASHIGDGYQNDLGDAVYSATMLQGNKVYNGQNIYHIINMSVSLDDNMQASKESRHAKVYSITDPVAAQATFDNLNYRGPTGQRIPLVNAVQLAVSHGDVIVASGGNNGYFTDPWSGGTSSVIGLGGLPYFMDGQSHVANINGISTDINPYHLNWRNNFVAVVSIDVTPTDPNYHYNPIDPRNPISSFSNRCGVAKAWCIAAPGGNVTVAAPDSSTGYGIANGTSVAAPVVSGALAVLVGAFPQLTPAQALQVLFHTATDLGAPGDDDVYGWGLLNLQRAVSPSDSGWKIALPGSALPGLTTAKTANVTASSISLPPAFGSVGTNNLNVMFLDEYNKNYFLPLSALISNKSSPLDSSSMFAMLGNSPFDYNVTMGSGVKFSSSFADPHDTRVGFTSSQDTNDAPKLQKSALSFSVPTKSGDYHAALAYNGNPSEVLGFGAFEGMDVMPKEVSSAFKNPYMALAGNANASEAGFKQDGINVNFGFFSGTLEENPADFEHGSKITGTYSDLTWSDKRHDAVSFMVGVNQESDSLLGAQATGALALGNGSSTRYSAMAGKYALSNNLSFLANYNRGVTTIKGAANSLFTNVGNIVTDSFALGFEYKDMARDNDKLRVSVSQPMRVRSAQADLSLPQTISPDGSIGFENHRISLTPTGREMDVETYYDLAMDSNASVKAGLTLRLDPNNDATASNEAIAIVKYNLTF